MYKLKTVDGYSSKMSLRETEKAIKLLKDTFERKLSHALNLERISAPVFVPAAVGINDDLNGTERAVRFDIKEIPECDAEIVHSLAKWKRMALSIYDFHEGEGLYTDMNAIRRDDSVDNTHSIYVDQWDWEKVIGREQRNEGFLKNIVQKIVHAIVDTSDILKAEFPQLHTDFSREVFFISSQELYDRYPNLSGKEREREIVRLHKTVFITKIGDKLSCGEPHDGRAPDYDDWTLNGDLLFWHDILNDALEISSMGIRVDAERLAYQLQIAGKSDRAVFIYHQAILNDRLPLTIGGGIGQSRLCMLLLQKLHVGEVHVSIWPHEMEEECKKAGIRLL